MFSAVKYYLECQVEFHIEVPESNDVQRTTAQFYVPSVISSSEPLYLHNLAAFLENIIESFASRGSGWNVRQIWSLSLYIEVFRPTAGSSFVMTPPENCKKKAVLNIRNHNNNKCFQYSVVAALHPAISNKNNPYTYHKFSPNWT